MINSLFRMVLASVSILGLMVTPSWAADEASNQKVELIILGAAAGRTSYGGHPDGGFSAAIAVGESRYIIDFGRGWHDRYYQAGLGTAKYKTGFSGLESVRAAFITHLHSDHVVGYPELLPFGATEGLRRKKEAIQIYGPGSRGSLTPQNIKSPSFKEIVNPSSPNPGTKEMTDKIYEAFAADLNDNILDSGMPNPHKYINANDIKIPEGIVPSADGVPPRMPPFEIYRDELIKVTATLVPHPPMYPAFALRFDTNKGAIVFSGDTNKSENLIELAKDAKVLVHEVINHDWAYGLFPPPRSEDQASKLDHLIKSHTDVREVGEIAEKANVKYLVLSHLAPPTISDAEWIGAVKGFSGRVAVGRALFRVTLE